MSQSSDSNASPASSAGGPRLHGASSPKRQTSPSSQLLVSAAHRVPTNALVLIGEKLESEDRLNFMATSKTIYAALTASPELFSHMQFTIKSAPQLKSVLKWCEKHGAAFCFLRLTVPNGNVPQIALARALKQTLNLEHLVIKARNSDLGFFQFLLQKLIKLKKLHLECKTMFPTSAIQHHPSIEDLVLDFYRHNELPDLIVDASWIPRGVKKLNLMPSYFCAKVFIEIGDIYGALPHLESLSLGVGRYRWTSHPSPFWKVSEQLTYLHFDCGDDENNFTLLHSVTKLQALQVLSVHDPAQDLNSYSNLQPLQHLTGLELHLSDGPDDNLESVFQLTQLRSLVLKVFEIDSIDGIESLVNLTALDLSKSYNLDRLPVLQCTRLQRLNIQDTCIYIDSLALLPADVRASLTSLCCDHTGIGTPNCSGGILSLSNLKELYILTTDEFAEYGDAYSLPLPGFFEACGAAVHLTKIVMNSFNRPLEGNYPKVLTALWDLRGKRPDMVFEFTDEDTMPLDPNLQP